MGDILLCRRCGGPVAGSLHMCRWCRATVAPGLQVYLKKYAEAYKLRQEKLLRDANNAQFGALTEDQWLQTCLYFGGCAMCGKNEIQSKVYVVPPSMGGKYAEWNVIPFCEECSTHYDIRKSVLPTQYWQRKKAVREHIEKVIIPFCERRINEQTERILQNGEGLSETE